MSRLRSSMDLCLEQLPTLLKIEVGGALPVTQLLPRVLSQLRALSVYSESGSSVGAEERMSETMGYVIQMVRLDSIFFSYQFFQIDQQETSLEDSATRKKEENILNLFLNT